MLNRRTRILAALLLVLGIGACGDDPDPREPWIEIGTGASQFEPLTAGQEVPLVMGPQGGYHVWGAFRGGDFDHENLTIEFVLVRGTTDVVAGASYIDDGDIVDGGIEYSRVTVILRDVEPEDISGDLAILALRVRTRDGLELRDEIEIVPICCE